MKVSGKGIIVILVFLVAIPVVIDIILVTILPQTRERSFTMSVFLLTRYLRLLPVYIVYLVIAFGIIQLVRIYKEQSNP
jgi:hypothetical protein